MSDYRKSEDKNKDKKKIKREIRKKEEYQCIRVHTKKIYSKDIKNYIWKI